MPLRYFSNTECTESTDYNIIMYASENMSPTEFISNYRLNK